MWGRAMKDSMTGKRSWHRWITRGLTALVVLLIVAFVAVSWVIGTDVRAVSDAALEVHAGDPVGALMAFVETPTHSLRDRNRAVWALGVTGGSSG